MTMDYEPGRPRLDGGGTPNGGARSTDQAIDYYVDQWWQAASQRAQLAQQPYSVERDETLDFLDARLINIARDGAELGFNVLDGTMLTEEESANASRGLDIQAANLSARYAELAESSRSNRADEQLRGVEEQGRNRRFDDQIAEDSRSTNISSMLDILENDVATGNLTAREAENRVRAATDSANVQRDVLNDHAGRMLPAGTAHFPNLGPTGAVATLAEAMGFPFTGFETMGTFGINPAAITNPITQAAQGSSMPGIMRAQDSLLGELARLGVPTGR